jgi:hypothetical protein
MALQLNLADTLIGLPAPEAYARISFLTFDTRTGEVVVHIETHATAAARTAGKTPVGMSTYRGKVGVDLPNLDDTISGVRAVIYAWLKSLPDFVGAVDV